jgi:hypothetical protein
MHMRHTSGVLLFSLVAAALALHSSLLPAAAQPQVFESVRLHGNNEPGLLVVATAEDSPVIVLRGTDGQMSTGGNGFPGRVRVANAENEAVISLIGESARINAGGNGMAGSLRLADAQNEGSIFLSADTGRVQTKTLRITGGGDIAEDFLVSGATAIAPGLLVAIDPDRPGELRVTARPYDRTVAGVISGAKGLMPGVTLAPPLTTYSNNQPIALAGRVYCWADASGEPIAPGDLLTTSAVPGHAMKVVDAERARGAVIGKAMTPLWEGRGLILVLIALQ